MSTVRYSNNREHWQPAETKIIDGLPVRFSDLCVCEFTVGDVEDPVVYAGGPLLTWRESAAGQWVMANAAEPPYWVKDLDMYTYQYRFRIMARLSEFDKTYFRLKYESHS